MSLLRTLALPALVIGSLALVGCADSDDDGLSNAQEKKLGSDPDVADSDGDGILDGDEVDMGLDPTLADSDGDGYNDNDEITEGSDPANAADMIYTGGWPYNPNKDSIQDPGFSGGTGVVGDVIPRFTVRDQFNEPVDIYDMAGAGKPILLDISAQWCPPCQDMAAWLEGGPSAFSDVNNVRRAVNNGDVIWVTFMAENFNRGQNATPATAAEWAEEFPQPNIPVLVDRQKQLTNWSGLLAFPSTILVNPDMTIEVWNPNGNLDALTRLSSDLPAN